MERGARSCEWLKRNRKEKCGKRCVGTFCGQHNDQKKKGMKEPRPCRGCGVGVLCDYRLCMACGGSALKQRLSRKRKKAKKVFELVLLELKAAQFERWIPYVISKVSQFENGYGSWIKQLSTFRGHSKPPSRASWDNLQGVSRNKKEAKKGNALGWGTLWYWKGALLWKTFKNCKGHVLP